MRRLCLSLLLLCGFSAGAMAGPNAGGTLVWHLDPTVIYTTDTTDYCGLSGIACQRDYNGCENGYDYEEDCQTLNFSQLNPTGPADGGTYVASILAAFPEGSCPRLAGVTFGFSTYNTDNIIFEAFGYCGDFELPTGSWPGELEGTAVTFSSAVVSQLVELYWFAAYAYYGDQDGSLALAPHPSQGGSFADDSIPSILDPIMGYSTLGLNGTTGETVLPAGPATGACCFEDGSCVVTTQADCAGTYQGDDTFCDPNPCPQPPATGACCFEDGSCVVSIQAECAGAYQGDDTVCDPNPCPQPPATGACCFEDGSCVVSTQVECVGTYQGDDTVCDPNPCPQPTPMGACCFEDGTCLILTQQDCESGGGRPHGNPPRVTDLGLRGTGQPGVYQGDDTVCDPNPCPQPPGTGACCFEDGSCAVTTEVDCAGVYQGDDTVCDPNPCPQPPGTGACCFEDGSCVVTTGADCAGVYQGDDTVCDPNPCPQPPGEGACCFEDGSCVVTTGADCAGAYQGNDTVCDPNPCPQPSVMGACCFEDGSCQMRTEADCGTAGGSYQGDDVVCDPNPCAANLGALDITATLGGYAAVVDVDVTGPGGPFDGQTPLLLEDLVPGDYDVVWTLPGSDGCSETYTVGYGETVPATCAPAPNFVSVLQFVIESTPNRIDMADLDREVTIQIGGFTGDLDARSIDLDRIYLGEQRVDDADVRVVGVKGMDEGRIELTVPARAIVDAARFMPGSPQQNATVDVWTLLENGWVRSRLNVVLYRSSAAVSSLSSDGKFGATVRPNPAQGDAFIEWNSPVAGETELAIYDASGRVLRVLVSESRSAGVHQAQWDGRDASGVAMPSGVYYYRLSLRETGEEISDKIYLVR